MSPAPVPKAPAGGVADRAVGDGERAARAALVRAHEPGEPLLAAAVLAIGATELLRRWRAGTEVGVTGADGAPQTVDRSGLLRRRLAGVDGAAELAAGTQSGARLVCPGDGEWPDGLADLEQVDRTGRAGPPVGLWVRGVPHLDDACRGAVAVVGSRAATAYGASVAGELAAELAEGGRCVLSGGAYGIDAAAHRGALAAGGRSVAVLACGVDVAYPRGNAALLARVLEDGLVVSECPPGAVPHRVRFLARNRLIAALSAGTVVVEAAARSGALSTARWARDLGRPVLGVPGPVTSALSVGVHGLLRDGEALLVRSAQDVLAALAPLGEVPDPVVSGPDRPWDALGPVAAAVLEAVPARGAIDVDALLRRTGLRLAGCLQALRSLATAGLVEADGPRWRLGPVLRRRGGA